MEPELLTQGKPSCGLTTVPYLPIQSLLEGQGQMTVAGVEVEGRQHGAPGPLQAMPQSFQMASSELRTHGDRRTVPTSQKP